MEIFEKFAYWLRNKGVSVGLLRQNQKSWSEADLVIRAKNIAPQKLLAPLLDSEFDVDYDFAIKHVPI